MFKIEKSFGNKALEVKLIVEVQLSHDVAVKYSN